MCAIDDYIESRRPRFRSIVSTLREIVLETLPGVAENVRWDAICYQNGHEICYIRAARSHASLGFVEGAELPDPAGRLRGDGTKLRYVRIDSEEEIDAKQFSRWIRHAAGLGKSSNSN